HGFPASGWEPVKCMSQKRINSIKVNSLGRASNYCIPCQSQGTSDLNASFLFPVSGWEYIV
ncbi:hypothetical protein, partial [Rivularia sp. UHCC 0363]|uniref:hypothetical protein n=1 Tax=Rivularia sp. UHCC 0363 TaxID=3110244 RepID=UPI002B20CCF4